MITTYGLVSGGSVRYSGHNNQLIRVHPAKNHEDMAPEDSPGVVCSKVFKVLRSELASSLMSSL